MKSGRYFSAGLLSLTLFVMPHHGVSLGASLAPEDRLGLASAPQLAGSVSNFVDFPEAPIDLPSRLNVELLRSSLVHLSVEREGFGRIDAVGRVLWKRFYTLCLGANLDVRHRLVVGWSGFLDSSRMMGSESWQVFGLGAAIWGSY